MTKSDAAKTTYRCILTAAACAALISALLSGRPAPRAGLTHAVAGVAAVRG